MRPLPSKPRGRHGARLEKLRICARMAFDPGCCLSGSDWPTFQAALTCGIVVPGTPEAGRDGPKTPLTFQGLATCRTLREPPSGAPLSYSQGCCPWAWTSGSAHHGG